MNKKGAEMNIKTIIVIVLVLIVLVVLIYGFTTGWGTLWNKIISLGGSEKENVDTIALACQLSCTSNREYDYCNLKRSLILGNKMTAFGSCGAFESLKGFITPCQNFKCNSDVKLECKKDNKPANCETWEEITSVSEAGEESGSNSQETKENSLSQSGAIAINLPDESMKISYARIKEENKLLSNNLGDLA